MHLAKSGRLIVKLGPEGAAIRAGELLVDASGKRLGRVIELIGPVNAPYASVIPMTDRTGKLIGTKVFSGTPKSPHRAMSRGESKRKSR